METDQSIHHKDGPTHWLYPNDVKISTIWLDPTQPTEAFPALQVSHQCGSCAEDGNEVMLYFQDYDDLAAFALGTKELVDKFIDEHGLELGIELALRDGFKSNDDYYPPPAD